jgi:uncharacterized protein (TIGR03790 family)
MQLRQYLKREMAAVACTLVLCTSGLAATEQGAVKPENVLLIANSSYTGSVELAKYYAEKRAVPLENLFVLKLPTTEDVNRDCFNLEIQGPIRERIAKSSNKIRCIMVFYGVPLNIWDPQTIQRKISKLKQDLEGTKKGTFQGESTDLERQITELEGEAKEITKKAASVDSELALLGRPHSLSGWVESPFISETPWPEGCYWVARIDATTADDARSMIDGALEAEKKGLKGTAYFDARGLSGKDDYSKADAQIRHAAEITRTFGFNTVLDNRPELFGKNECPDAAIYWGWYSLAKYVDSFRFAPGAIAVHIASGECDSLREGSYWCRHLIEHGAAVTMGPTNEPYLEAFPRPDLFLEKVYSGACIGAAYYQTLPWLSWRMVLLGDPLYRPFARKAETGETAKKPPG